MQQMTITCIEFESDNYDLLLHYGNETVATVQIMFKDHGDFDTNCVLDKASAYAPVMHAMHATSMVLSTFMQAWSTDHETVADVFSNGALVVDPALYLSLYPQFATEQCNDSDTKQVVCKQCDTTYDGELPKWAEGDEECPECDHVQYEHKQ